VTRRLGARSGACALVVAMGWLVSSGLATVAKAESSSGFALKGVVARLTDKSSKNDKGAGRLHAELKNQFRYEGIRVVEARRFVLVADQV